MNAEVNKLLRGIAARIDEAAKKPLYSATAELKGVQYFVSTHEIPETSTGGKFETAVYPVGKNGKPNLKAKPLYRTVDFTAEDAKETFDGIVKGRGLKNVVEPPASDD